MKKLPSAVRVFAPATVANVAVGYDILGFAIEGPGDEIVARRCEQKGLRITSISGTKKDLPRLVEQNTAGYGALKLLEHLAYNDSGVELQIYKKMPFSSGMGSSAASAAAGVLAVNELLGRPLNKRDLVPFAVMGESAADGAFHGDNVIPSLLGGIVLIRDNATFDFIKLPAPSGLYVALVYPHIEILTKDARAVLSSSVSIENLIRQTGNIACFVASLYSLDFELMKRSLTDHVIEPQRAKLIPHFYDIQDLAMNAGALNFTISGAGPSMFGFCRNSADAERVCATLSNFLSQKDIVSDSYVSKINTRGAYKM